MNAALNAIPFDTEISECRQSIEKALHAVIQNASLYEVSNLWHALETYKANHLEQYQMLKGVYLLRSVIDCVEHEMDNRIQPCFSFDDGDPHLLAHF